MSSVCPPASFLSLQQPFSSWSCCPASTAAAAGSQNTRPPESSPYRPSEVHTRFYLYINTASFTFPSNPPISWRTPSEEMLDKKDGETFPLYFQHWDKRLNQHPERATSLETTEISRVASRFNKDRDNETLCAVSKNKKLHAHRGTRNVMSQWLFYYKFSGLVSCWYSAGM